MEKQVAPNKARKRDFWPVAVWVVVAKVAGYIVSVTFKAVYDAVIDRAVPDELPESGTWDAAILDLGAWLDRYEGWLHTGFTLLVASVAVFLCIRVVRRKETEWTGVLKTANDRLRQLDPDDTHEEQLRKSWRVLNAPSTRSGRDSKTAADLLAMFAPDLDKNGGGMYAPAIERHYYMRDSDAMRLWLLHKLVTPEEHETPRAMPATIRGSLGDHMKLYFLTADGETVVKWQHELRGTEPAEYDPELFKFDPAKDWPAWKAEMDAMNTDAD